MSLLDDVKVAVRVSEGTDDYDDELQDLIDAALADLTRVGIKPDLLDEDEPAPLVKQAVKLYSKGHFGFDNDERSDFLDSYERVVVDLLNSSANIAASRTSMADCVIEDIPDQLYTGHTVRPVPTVSFDGAAMAVGEDFLCRYSRNVEVGTARVYVEGTGAYGGVACATFEIVEA